MAGFPPDDLPTGPAFRSFSCLFMSPVCRLADLAEEWADEGDDVVGNEGVTYDMAGWEHSAPSLSPEPPTLVLRANFLRSSVGHGTLPRPLEAEL